MKKIAIFAAVLAAGVGTLAAQNYYGYVPSLATFEVSRMHDLGLQRATLGTTRSAAMGGAFTSLGADLSSMSINPAGLGMYQNSEFGITFGPTVCEITSSMRGQRTSKDSRTGFALNNFGAAFNMWQSAGKVTSFTLGVGYQRLADYNYRSRLDITGAPQSIVEMFDAQLEGYVGRIGLNNWDNSDPFGTGAYAANLQEWGAQLARKSFLLGQQNPDVVEFYVPTLAAAATLDKSVRTLSKGSQGEYAFSGGWNFGNKFYFGFTLGVVDLWQDREVVYSETYFNNGNAEMPTDGMDYSQRIRTSGEGYNAKFGVIWRPDPTLRVGLAFHTPTVMTVRNTFNSRMDRWAPGGGHDWATTPEVEFQERFYTPARLLAGVSYTIGGKAIVAADYERAFYGGMRVWSGDYTMELKDKYRNAIKSAFTGSNTLRLGAEVMASDELFVRAGYVWSQNGVRDEARATGALNAPVCYQSDIVSAGFGVKIGARTSLDMTYSLAMNKFTDHDTYYYGPKGGAPYFPGVENSDTTHQKGDTHNIMLSLNFRF